VPSKLTHKLDLKNKATIDTLSSSVQNSPAPVRNNSTKGHVVDRRVIDPSSPLASRERRQIKNRRKTPEEIKNEKVAALEQIEHRNDMKLQQHRKKILLAGCEPVMGYNYDCLAMDDYPDNAIISAARRDRDYWLMLCGIFASAFLFGLFGFVPAWVGGVGCGLFLVSLIFAFTSFRRNFFERPPLSNLLQIRKRIEFSALNHITFLEGKDGLAWRCAKLVKYNENLNRRLFSGLFQFSRERELLNVIKNKKHIRLYLLLMIESQKAYKRLQKQYLEQHFTHLDQGWDDTINETEAQKLEQSLNKAEGDESTHSNS